MGWKRSKNCERDSDSEQAESEICELRGCVAVWTGNSPVNLILKLQQQPLQRDLVLLWGYSLEESFLLALCVVRWLVMLTVTAVELGLIVAFSLAV